MNSALCSCCMLVVVVFLVDRDQCVLSQQCRHPTGEKRQQGFLFSDRHQGWKPGTGSLRKRLKPILCAFKHDSRIETSSESLILFCRENFFFTDFKKLIIDSWLNCIKQCHLHKERHYRYLQIKSCEAVDALKRLLFQMKSLFYSCSLFAAVEISEEVRWTPSYMKLLAG